MAPLCKGISHRSVGRLPRWSKPFPTRGTSANERFDHRHHRRGAPSGLSLVRFGQIAASAVAWMVCFGLFARADAKSRPALVACLAIATAGEIFLSLVWGLYQYRLGNIPLFVPPGHVLLFFLGMQIAARIPDRSVAW